MIYKALFLFAVVSLVGCASNGGGHSEFYTWVDETGQMRTVKRSSHEDTPAELDSSKAVVEVQKSRTKTENKGQSDLNPADFMPSDQVDAKLRDSRLFAWQDETGKQAVSEVEKSEIKRNTEDLGVEVQSEGRAGRRFGAQCCDNLSGSKIYLWNELAGRELKLEDYYSFEKSLEGDALILDFADSEVDDIRLKTFIKREKLALPDVILLDERFQIVKVLVTPFSHYVEESWASYGYMQGRIEKQQLDDVEYLVILPSQQIGVLELGDKQTKITDLGSIMVQRDAPAP